MTKSNSKILSRTRRKARVRAKVSGTSNRPRLAVFRSLKHIYAQVIDDTTGKTLASASSLELKSKTAKTATAEAVGKLVAEKLGSKGVKSVVFDRGGFLYHGRVKALADSARAGGLEF